MIIHYLQHVPFENPGSILRWAKENHYPVTSTHLYKQEPLPDVESFDWLVVMGGPMNIYEDALYPWLTAEKVFIRSAIAAEKVVIGICLGGQLIADVIGGKVVRNPYSEIGWFPVSLNEEMLAHSRFSHFPKEPVVFEWHGDTFVDLPEEARVFASNEACQNQAFVYKDKVFAFQFHLENTAEIIKSLIDNCSNELVQGKYIQSPEELLAYPEYIRQDNNLMADFLTKLAQKER